MSEMKKMEREIEEAKKQQIEQGYHGEEYERWKAREPVARSRLVARCYEEVRPLYEFLINYAQQTANAGQTLPFDISLLDSYDKYLKMLWKSPEWDAKFLGFSLSILSHTVQLMVKKEITYHKGIEQIYIYLKHTRIRESHKPMYKGEHFDALVERHHVRHDEWSEEGHRIAAENVRKRGEMNDLSP